MQKQLFASLGIGLFLLGMITGLLFERYYTTHKLLLKLGIRTIEFSNVAERTAVPAAVESPLVVLIFGQSNVANTIPLANRQQTSDAKVLNWYRNRLYLAQDPLLGNTGNHSSLWLNVAQQLRRLNPDKTIILVPAARNNTSIDDWLSGSVSQLPKTIQQQLAKQGLKPDVIIWGQGERDSMDGMSTEEYASKLFQFRQSLLDLFPATPFILSITSRCFQREINFAIRTAQQQLVQMEYTRIGPDTDRLGNDYRFDGCHFNQAAKNILAPEWAEAIHNAVHLK